VPVPTARPTIRQAAVTAPIAPLAVATLPAPIPPASLPDVANASDPGATGSTSQWPFREADKDRVPLEMVLAYATPTDRNVAQMTQTTRPEPMGEAPVRAIAAAPAKPVAMRDNVTTIAKKLFVRPAAAEPAPQRVTPPVAVAANAGMRYDDPWLRAMILTPSISDQMTTTLYGEPDFTELRALMNKPTTTVAMSFNNDPYPGISADRFSGEAVVFLTTYAFPQRTASLR
jgi:hypothetical protein